MPGAGKSTLLASLPAARAASCSTPRHQRARSRAAARGALPPVPAARAPVAPPRPSSRPRCPARRPWSCTCRPRRPGTRAAVAAPRRAHPPRAAHLLWLHVDAGEALRGQRERGRVVPAGVVRRATPARRGAPPPSCSASPPRGLASVTVLDRATARGGLRLDTDGAGASRPPRAAPASCSASRRASRLGGVFDTLSERLSGALRQPARQGPALRRRHRRHRARDPHRAAGGRRRAAGGPRVHRAGQGAGQGRRGLRGAEPGPAGRQDRQRGARRRSSAARPGGSGWPRSRRA